MSATTAGLFCSSAQVGEWLKPADCKSAPPRRYEGSNPSLCTRDLNESSLHCAGCLRGAGRSVVGNLERSANPFRHPGGSGDVCAQDLAAAQGRDASGSREWNGAAVKHRRGGGKAFGDVAKLVED